MITVLLEWPGCARLEGTITRVSRSAFRWYSCYVERRKSMPKRAVIFLLAGVICLPFAPQPPGADAARTVPSQVSAQQPGCQSFSQTGQSVCGRFLSYWKEHGGLAQHGYPIGPQV